MPMLISLPPPSPTPTPRRVTRVSKSLTVATSSPGASCCRSSRRSMRWRSSSSPENILAEPGGCWRSCPASRSAIACTASNSRTGRRSAASASDGSAAKAGAPVSSTSSSTARRPPRAPCALPAWTTGAGRGDIERMASGGQGRPVTMVRARRRQKWTCRMCTFPRVMTLHAPGPATAAPPERENGPKRRDPPHDGSQAHPRANRGHAAAPACFGQAIVGGTLSCQ